MNKQSMLRDYLSLILSRIPFHYGLQHCIGKSSTVK